jgi:two-component system phosphate regulon response regulator PhoB
MVAGEVKKKHVLVVEDEIEIRDLIALQLQRQSYFVTTSAHAEEALKIIRSQKFDLLILDWMLPGMNGIELIRQIRADTINSQQPILMVTAKTEPEDIVVGLEAGADDYVTKPFEVSVLMARVQALMRRSNSFDPSETSSAEKDIVFLGNLRVDLKKYEVSCEKEPISLTPSEFKLLKTLALHGGGVLTRDQLISSVQGEGVSVVGRTVDTHVFGLRKKLGACSDVIETVRGVGYRVKA